MDYSGGVKLLKYQRVTPVCCVIMSLILVTTLFTKHWYYKEKLDADDGSRSNRLPLLELKEF